MIGADLLYNFVKLIGNQYQTGRMSPDEFNTAWKRAETEYVNTIFGVGRSPSSSVGGSDQEQDALRVLRTSSVISNDKFGWMDLPEDYLRWGSLYIITGLNSGKVVTLLSSDKWAARSESKLNPPIQYPIAKMEGERVLAKPVSSRFNLSYLRTPVTPLWSYTLDSNSRPVYDATTSVDSELPEFLTNEIAFRICSYLGINISKAELVQYSEMKTQ